jgi:hypothetical protein
MTIVAPVTGEAPSEVPQKGYPYVFPTSDEALKAAIHQFPTQAEFYRALIARSKKTLTKAAVSQWVRRRRGAPSDFAPDIEAISDVPCEELCRDVSWEVLRKHTPPPVFVPRGKTLATGCDDNKCAHNNSIR